ncbi:MAG TPA: calcium-binding protein, partial [Solirubrobacteraceae bacterium]|nr:calcium-binding protein [Solirubrobacteraceae bacterium]
MTAAGVRRVTAASVSCLLVVLVSAGSVQAAASGVCASNAPAPGATMTITIDNALPPPTTTISVAGEIVTINGAPQPACTGLSDIVINGDDGSDVVLYSGLVSGSVVANLGGGDDDFTAGGAQPVTVNGEGDDDVLRGGTGADTLNGGADDDLVFGGADEGDMLDGGGDLGDELTYAGVATAVVVNLSGSALAPAGTDSATGFARVTGGDGADTITGDGGANVLDGGPGSDTVTYLDRAGGVRVTLDGVANDGAGGGAEGDDVIAENVTGGAGADTLTGDAGANRLDGAGGVDTVEYSDKTLAGQAVRVTLDGVANDGEAGGAEGDDVIAENVTGGAGADTLTGNAGANRLDGAGGVDTVDYADKIGPLQGVRVTLDGVANDGEAGGAEGD